MKIRNTDIVLPVKKVGNSRDGNYSFEFCPLHAAHAYKLLMATSHSTIFDITMRPVREDQRHRLRFTR